MIHLTRFAATPFGTFGRMVLEDNTQFYTCENRWNENRVGASCILPEPGPDTMLYDLVRDTTGKHQHYRLLDVPDRTDIEIHVGNTDLESRGCILVGLGLGWSQKYRWGITESLVAIDTLHRKLGDDTHKLTIRWSFKEK